MQAPDVIADSTDDQGQPFLRTVTMSEKSGNSLNPSTYVHLTCSGVEVSVAEHDCQPLSAVLDYLESGRWGNLGNVCSSPGFCVINSPRSCEMLSPV